MPFSIWNAKRSNKLIKIICFIQSFNMDFFWLQKQIILCASIFAVICASKEQTNDGGYVAAESSITSNHIYSQPIQDNIAAETEVAKRGATAVTTSTSSSSENHGQSSQIDVGALESTPF